MGIEGSLHRGVQSRWNGLTEAAPAGLASLAGGSSSISLDINLGRSLNLLSSVGLSFSLYKNEGELEMF